MELVNSVNWLIIYQLCTLLNRLMILLLQIKVFWSCRQQNAAVLQAWEDVDLGFFTGFAAAQCAPDIFEDIYCLFQQPGFQYFNRGFVGFDFPHQDIKYIFNFLQDAPRFKMHNCIAGESIISWRRQGFLTEATQQGDTARCHFNLIIFILSSFNLQLYDTGSLIFTKCCPQCLHHLASVSSHYSLGPANYLTQLLTTVPSNSTVHITHTHASYRF